MIRCSNRCINAFTFRGRSHWRHDRLFRLLKRHPEPWAGSTAGSYLYWRHALLVGILAHLFVDLQYPNRHDHDLVEWWTRGVRGAAEATTTV